MAIRGGGSLAACAVAGACLNLCWSRGDNPSGAVDHIVDLLSCMPATLRPCLWPARWPSQLPSTVRHEPAALQDPDVTWLLYRMEMITPKDYVGSIMELSQGRRGDFVDMQYMTEERTTLVYDLPLAEVGQGF